MKHVPTLPTSGKRDRALALGNFDGVHRGHQAVLAATVAEARRLGIPACALTLEPHPRTFFNPGGAPFRLTLAPGRTRLLKACGMEEAIILPFDSALASLEAERFAQDILVGQFGAKHVVAGADFVFGKGRAGTMARLRDWAAPLGLGVTEIAPLGDDRGEAYSSTAVRIALAAGDLAAAERVLGRPWALSGMIVPGAARGRTLGVPTANMVLGAYQRPRFGVYAIRARRAEPDGVTLGPFFPGVANIGCRPTVDGATETLEFHLFDFDDRLYGQTWEVELRHFLRPEQAFPSLAALKDQIFRDIKNARALTA